MQLFTSWLFVLLLAGVGIASSDNVREHLQAKAKADGKYIVVLQPDRGSLLGQLITGILGRPLEALAQFTLGAFSGFNAELSKEQLERLKKNPNVAYIEEDGTLKTWGVVNPEPQFSKRADVEQNPSSWGLERISQRGRATEPFRYRYDSTAGQGTCIYVIDSGIYTGHNEFGGRASFVQNFVYGENGDDLSGHGTAVAGAAAGASFGVAKAARIYSIKVCNRSGSCDVSSVVAAISSATNHARGQQCPNGVIINLSLGGPSAGWQSVRDAVRAATQAGAFVVAAAGNEAANVNNYLPASAAGACSVGAIDQNDVIWPSSNIGPLSVFAPGVGIQTAALGNPGANIFVDGTSMSAPLVAGLGAYLWAKDGRGGGSSPGAALCAKIQQLSTLNAIGGNLRGSPNRLAWNGMQ